MIDEFKKLVEQSEKILVTSHIGPDPDAFCSAILLGATLKLNYPDKVISITLEELPLGLDFLDGAEEVERAPVLEKLQSLKPDLLIMLDGNNYDRFSRKNGSKLRSYVAENKVKTVIIDHHEPADKDEADVYINQQSPATAQDVYQICFDQLKLKKPAGYAQTALLGFYADTGGFAYIKDFSFASELINSGASVEFIKNKLSQYTKADMEALSELSANVTLAGGYSYSFLSDEFINNWLASGKTPAALQTATHTFVNEFVRNIEGRTWGFIVYRNALEGDGVYSVSFRALGTTKDVSIIASSLGGGGHKPAAGAKVKAGSVQAAIEIVKQAISD